MDERFTQPHLFDDLPSDSEIADIVRDQPKPPVDPYASQTQRSESIVELRDEDLAAEQTGGWRREVPARADTTRVVITDDPELNAEWQKLHGNVSPSVPTESLTSQQKNANERRAIAKHRRRT